MERNAATSSRRRSWLLALCAAGSSAAMSQTLPTTGCPMFHCDIEALGQITQPMISAPSTLVSNSTLGFLPAQGCSGDGTVLACLFLIDQATGSAAGTLKVLNATTLQPIWGSAGAANSFNLVPSTTSDGQVPTLFSNGTLVAGDGGVEVLYNTSTGAALSKLKLTSTQLNFGLEPISTGYGVVSQIDGTLTLIDTANFTKVQTLTLTDPANGGALQLASPSTGANNVLYAVAVNPVTSAGYLFSIKLTAKSGLVVGSVFPFTGKSGASPVIILPAVTGLSGNLVLLHAPGLPGDASPQNHWVALSDTGTGLTPLWSVVLGPSITVQVSPVVDPASLTLFYQLKSDPNLYRLNLLSGASVATYNMQTIGGFPGTPPGSFALDGHIGVSNAGGVFTVLLAGRYLATSNTGAQYVFTFQPTLNPTALQWSSTISHVPWSYTAAWNFVTAAEPGVYCPIAIADYATQTTGASSIMRVCDY